MKDFRVIDEFGFKLPTEIVGKPGAARGLAGISKRFGERPLFVYPAQLAELASTYLQLLKDDGVAVVSFEQAEPEPTIEYIDSAANSLRGQGIDVVIGFGGGSAMDLAKALAIALTQSEGIWMYANLSNRPPLPLEWDVLPVITVPTTSGTGSEVTPYAVLTKPDTQQKGTIQEPAIFPRVAVVDAELMTGMPASLTASTGMDAFAHALEATINISKHAPMAELFGKEAMKMVFANLKGAIEQPTNLEFRQNMALATALAGMAISHRGTTTTHAIAEPLGALTHIPHGLGVTISTIPVLRHTIEDAPEGLAQLWREVCVGQKLENETAEAEAFVDQLEALITAVGMNKTVESIIGKDDCQGLDERLIDSIMKFKFRPLKQHPVEFDANSLRPIVRDIIWGQSK